ncbi:MAG TPA: hypothetical protein VGB30_10965 [bacterium]|jgi:hypothetical protein
MNLRLQVVYTLWFIMIAVACGCQSGSDARTNYLQESPEIQGVLDDSGSGMAINGDDLNKFEIPSYEEVSSYNPKLIVAFLGEKTRDDWFKRRHRSYQRMSTLELGLRYYFAQFSQYPADWLAYDESGFFPIRALDPISEEPIIYGNMPQNDNDWSRIGITASSREWIFDTRNPDKDGNWGPEPEYKGWPDQDEMQIIQQEQITYPNNVALRGALLAETIQHILRDYEYRRREMPLSAVDLLDGLWHVHDEWAKANNTIDPSENGGFLFGLDDQRHLAVARWKDMNGDVYYKQWLWEFRPIGWNEPFTYEESPGFHGVPGGMKDENFIPEQIIWKCNLNN